jgi:serine/threonine-protein kinase
MTRAESLIVIAAALVTAAPRAANAQSAEAEVLFRDGRALIKQGRLAEGCAKIEASERLESSVGTLLNLGDCREKLGKVAGAWAAFKKAEAQAKHAGNDDKRENEARRRALALEPKLPSLTIELATPIAGLVLRRDGEVIDPALIGTAIPLDPGTYTITAEAPGRAPWRTDLVIQYKSKRRLQVPALAARHVVAEPPRPVPMRVERSVWSPWRKASAVLGIGGVAAIGAGVFFRLRSADQQEDADARCPLVVCNDPVALELNDDARTNARRSNMFYIGGAVAVGSAVALWFIGGPTETTVVTPVISSDHAGAALSGSF